MEHSEEQILKTIAISKEAFYEGESLLPMRGWEFLMQQGRYIQKRWWVFQGITLGLLFLLLQSSNSDSFTQQCLGSAGPLFIILMLPELWKNRSNCAMEVESAAFYSLRQIYAARMTLFAGVDFLLLSGFFLGVFVSGQVTAWEMLVQFVLPMLVTCCICFRCLYAGRNSSEVFSMLLCILWTAVWTRIVLHEQLYPAISRPVWGAMLTVCLGYLGCCIFIGQRKWRKIWEVKPVWN